MTILKSICTLIFVIAAIVGLACAAYATDDTPTTKTVGLTSFGISITFFFIAQILIPML